MKKIESLSKEKYISVIAWIILGTGVLARIILWWNNRGLFIDEANLARNIYERNFAGLAKPLVHEQFAPPLFLWITKLNTLLLGFDERVLRFFPVLSGIIALILFLFLLKKILPMRSAWYPLALMATGALYLRYGTEFKQYTPDALMTLILLLSALRFEIKETPALKFFSIWFLLGSIAIWLSMPSVFILAGVGAYYFFEALKHKNKQIFILLGAIFLIWLVQFGVYYMFILKPQIGSDYLQNFHQWYFLDPFPKSFDEFKAHNWIVIKGLFEATSSANGCMLVFNIILTFLGIIHFISTRDSRGLLFVLPGILLFIASAMKSYSLMERLVIFYTPCWLALSGIGFEYLLREMPRLFKVITVVFGITGAIQFSKLSYITHPLKFEEVRECLDFVRSKGLDASSLYLHNLASGGYTYYTQIHPDKAKWKSLQIGHQLSWDSNLREVFSNIPGRTAFIVTSLGEAEINTILEEIRVNNTIEEFLNTSNAKAIIFSPKK